MKKRYYLAIVAIVLLITLGGVMLNLKNIEGANTSSDISYIYVDIKGEVNKPGVYRVSENARLFQLIEIAGGLTSDADTTNVNMAVRMNDEDTYTIPTYTKQSSSNKLININTANIDELMNITGIGAVTAQSIIDYRTSKGKFKTINDLLNVNGIGSTTLDKIRSYITCE